MKVLTVGTFDLMHRGHIELFKKCKRMSRPLPEEDFSDIDFVVGLNTDEFIQKYKGKPPIMSFQERAEAIQSLDLADLILENDQEDGSIKRLIEYQQTDILVIGTDWHRKDYLKQIGLTEDYLEENNIMLLYVPYTQGISTTEIKKRINENLLNNPNTKS